MNLFLRSYILFGWSYLIFRLLTLPFYGQSGPGSWPVDKLIHFFLFGVFAILAYAVFLRWNKNGRQAMLCAGGLAFAYSGGLEILQYYVPGRSPAWADLLAGAAGAALFLAATLFYPRRPRLLLHACCAVCAAHLADELKNDYALTIYFYNPNIYPAEEYWRRLAETKRLTRINKALFLTGPYDHEKWRLEIKGLENEPEKGERCRRCYRLRLDKTARAARELGFAVFASTLTVSPRKDAAAVLAGGRELADKYGIKFLDRDFKKRDGFKKAMARARALGLYRQDYCGCEYGIKRRA